MVLAKRGIKIGNKEEIWKFYDTRFKNIQQWACKIIAKAWVKLIEPKKQSTHPYTGSDEGAPEWWPKPWGSGRDERVRHKEPDHLYKPGENMFFAIILSLLNEWRVLADKQQSESICSTTYSEWSPSPTCTNTQTSKS